MSETETDASETPTEAPVAPRGGPSWMQGGPGAVRRPPSVVSSAPPTVYVGETGSHGPRPGSADELFTARFSRTGRSPIPYGAVALVAAAVAWWAVAQARWDASAPGRPVRSEWWVNVTAVLLPGQDISLRLYSEQRMWIAIGALVATAVLWAVWIGRIGGNVRQGHGPFGAALPLVALPAWWLLPLALGDTTVAAGSRSELMLRYLIAFAVLFAQFLLLRWPTLNRIWRAGHLPYDLASIVLWLPMMIPWMMIFASNAFTLLAIGDDGDPADSVWLPTRAMVDWAQWTTRLTGIGIVALLVVVSVVQHQGLAADRRRDDEARLN